MLTVVLCWKTMSYMHQRCYSTNPILVSVKCQITKLNGLLFIGVKLKESTIYNVQTLYV